MGVQEEGTSLFRGAEWGYNPVWGYRMGVHPYLWYRMGVDPCFGVLDGVRPLFEDPPLFGLRRQWENPKIKTRGPSAPIAPTLPPPSSAPQVD